ncbi:MAG: CPBP family intramembrane metalloprotease [Desulfomonile tiedjei]|uniref:CPBP family intramembrane metalloprotease n=1 Tax=Desulfomonile tiedjei TaxID=2358 RepID=A0A9D6Z2C0_9BACT|nr:CPBP family intramembrane metalloprotease [Desulfomonile tiedjei]
MQGYVAPFGIPRVRELVGRAVLALIAAIFWGGIICFVFLERQTVVVQGVVIQIFFDGFFLLLIAPSLSRCWRPALLFGLAPERSSFRQYAFVVIPLLIVAIATTYLFYFPLSYVWPRFVEWKLLDQPRLITGTDNPLGNLLCFSYIVLIGPVFEEFLFRGLLLTRWALKWNARTAIFASSALFALGHDDIVGTFFVGYVLWVLYIKTKSLFVPMAVHIANNGICWILGCVDVLITGSDGQPTLAEWQSYWWMGLAATLIVAPWVVIFIKNHMPLQTWQIPHLALQGTGQEAEIRA